MYIYSGARARRERKEKPVHKNLRFAGGKDQGSTGQRSFRLNNIAHAASFHRNQGLTVRRMRR